MQLFYPAICGCAALLVYTTSLNCGFVFDDSAAILKNYDLRQTHPWTELFRNDFWGTAMKSVRKYVLYFDPSRYRASHAGAEPSSV